MAESIKFHSHLDTKDVLDASQGFPVRVITLPGGPVAYRERKLTARLLEEEEEAAEGAVVVDADDIISTMGKGDKRLELTPAPGDPPFEEGRTDPTHVDQAHDMTEATLKKVQAACPRKIACRAITCQVMSGDAIIFPRGITYSLGCLRTLEETSPEPCPYGLPITYPPLV